MKSSPILLAFLASAFAQDQDAYTQKLRGDRFLSVFSKSNKAAKESSAKAGKSKSAEVVDAKAGKVSSASKSSKVVASDTTTLSKAMKEEDESPDGSQDGGRCRFCELGIPDLTVLPPQTGGQTCGDVKQTATNHIQGDDLCEVIQSVEKVCCPEPVDPCTFCPDGIPDLALAIPAAGGRTCGEVRQLAADHVQGDDTCNTVQAVESICCPEPIDPADVCSFCGGGIPDPAVVLAEAGGQTCGEVQQTAASHMNGDVTCNAIQAVERNCCPGPADICTFCKGGDLSELTLDVVIPEADGRTCGEIKESAAAYLKGDPSCDAIQTLENKCCL